MKELHTTQIQKQNKNKNNFVHIPRQISFILSVKDEEGNLFDFSDMRIEFVLEVL